MKNLAFGLLLIGLAGCSDRAAYITTGLEGKSLPSFNLLLMDSTSQLNTEVIPSDKPIVLFFFNPYCPYCRSQTEEMVDNMKSLANIRFYLFSNFPFESVKQFYDQYKLNRYSNVTVGQDYDAYFGKYYNATGVPYTAIYGRDKKLKRALLGKVGSNLIKDIAIQ